MTNEEYNKWLILYFDMQSINLQFNCNDIASSLKAQRDKIKQFCIDCLTGVKHQADSFLFDTNACIFSTSETRELLFSHEEYLILEADTTKVVDGKYPLDYATEIVESNFLHLRLGGLRQCALTYSHLPRRNLIINNKART